MDTKKELLDIAPSFEGKDRDYIERAAQSGDTEHMIKTLYAAEQILDGRSK